MSGIFDFRKKCIFFLEKKEINKTSEHVFFITFTTNETYLYTFVESLSTHQTSYISTFCFLNHLFSKTI